MWAEVLDVQGAFLNGRFQNGEKVYMEVPEGFEKYYPNAILLLLLKTIYGTVQAAKQFWREMRKAFDKMEYNKSKADPCLFFKWVNERLVLWIVWVDDSLIAGSKEQVLKAKAEMKQLFDCTEVGELTEYVGCKIEHNKEERWMKLTQPVLLQSFEDEFDLDEQRPNPRTPMEAGQVLSKEDGQPKETVLNTKQYRSGVGKLLHMMRWSRPDVLNATRE